LIKVIPRLYKYPGQNTDLVLREDVLDVVFLVECFLLLQYPGLGSLDGLDEHVLGVLEAQPEQPQRRVVLQLLKWTKQYPMQYSKTVSDAVLKNSIGYSTQKQYWVQYSKTVYE
jgi:hypothetical protein